MDGPLLMVIFLLSIAVLLVLILKVRMNAFVALAATAIVTAVAVGMPLSEVGNTVSSGFGGTLQGIGMVTGLGVILGTFMFESGGLENLANHLIQKMGERRSPLAASVAGFITGIPVFGDVVYIMFAPMIRVLSRKTKISMTNYSCAISVATCATAALVLPTAAPLAVAGELDLNIGIFFFYALISALAGTLVGGVLYGHFLGKADEKSGHNIEFDFSDLEAEEKEIPQNKRKMLSVQKTISILLVPIVLILAGSFGPLFLGDGNILTGYLKFLGDKNIAMVIGVLYAAFISRNYLQKKVSEVMTQAADQVGLVLLITGAGGAYGKVLQETGIADYIAETFSQFNVPVLLLCFVISQIIRCAQGSSTVALMTTAAILHTMIMNSGISPILCGIAICAGGIGLSLPNDSGFWAISRFFHIDVKDTIRSWTIPGFVAGATVVLFASVLSLFQAYLPGL